MSQARKLISRHENKDMQKPIESTEEKRNRGVISCAECRRLKLKCDKAVPCTSCSRRGCAAICPNGKLVTGQGTRLVLANTEKLHEKILLMSDRIRLLEDSLSVLQSAVAPQETHPLLQSDLLDVKSIIDLHIAVDEDKVRKSAENANTNAEEESQYIEAFGMLALRNDDDTASFYGRSAGPESLPVGEVAKPLSPPFQSDLLHSVKLLSRSFPLAPVFSDTVDLNYLIQNHLPPWHRAWRLSQFYLSQAQWFSGSVSKRQVLEECLPLWYSEASDFISPGSVAPPTLANPSDTSTQLQGNTSHELALLFAIFCLGALIDTALPPAPDNEEASMYYSLARASLDLEPILDRPPSVSTIQTLSLLFICQRMNGDGVESAWGFHGLAMKLAQSIGLHRDCARWQLSSAEVQKRRFLFWELFVMDGWLNLNTDRLTTFYLPLIDCEFPSDPDPTIDDDGTILPSFPAWKVRFGYQCMSAVVKSTRIAKVPKYSTIIELDRKVRDMELPRYAQRTLPVGAGFAETMKHFMPLYYRNMVLVCIHRRFFAEAISRNPTDPMQSPYAPSFLAGYHIACEMLDNLRRSFKLFPIQITRVWFLWIHAFSSSEMLASVVTRASGAGKWSKTTGAALAELGRAVGLFREASTYSGRAAKFLPMLERLLQKAERTYVTAKPSIVRYRDIFSPSFSEPKAKDELSMFDGRINAMITRTNASYPGSFRPPQPSAAPTVLIQGFPQLHPTLRDQWVNLDGHINTQLANAQRDEYDTEADADASAYIEGSSSLAMQGYAGGDAPHEPAYPHPQHTFYPMVLPVSSSSSLQSALSYRHSKVWYRSQEREPKPRANTGGSEYDYESGSGSRPSASVERRYPSGESGYGQQQQTAYEAQALPLEHAYCTEFPAYAYPQDGMGLHQQQDQPPSSAHDQYGHGLIGQAESGPYGGYSGYDYAYGYGYVEELQQQQRLQEMWRSFGFYVDSPPRPDH